MKTFATSAILLCVLCARNPNLALAQAQPPSPALPAPDEAPLPGVLPTLPAGQPGGGAGIGGGGFTGAPGVGYYPADNVGYGYHAASTRPPRVIQFSQTEPSNMDTLQEDLNVMSLLLQKKIEYHRMGIPLLLRISPNGIESLFIDGFGAVFTLGVNFPLLPPPPSKAKESDPTTGSDDWNRARKELYGVREADEPVNPYNPGALPYDDEQVVALKRALLEALKNAANIRGLKSDDWVVVTVFGTEGTGPAAGAGGTTRRPGGRTSAPDTTPIDIATSRLVSGSGSRTGRGTVLTMRVRKSDAESFAKGKMNLDQFEQKATVAAYLGPAAYGSSALLRSGYIPGQYPVAPMAR